MDRKVNEISLEDLIDVPAIGCCRVGAHIFAACDVLLNCYPKRIVLGSNSSERTLGADRCRVSALPKGALSLLAPFSSLEKRHRWVGAEGDQFLLATKAIGKPPQLRAAWRDSQVKAAAIR